jgi:hypothetical protein
MPPIRIRENSPAAALIAQMAPAPTTLRQRRGLTTVAPAPRRMPVISRSASIRDLERNPVGHYHG